MLRALCCAFVYVRMCVIRTLQLRSQSDRMNKHLDYFQLQKAALTALHKEYKETNTIGACPLPLCIVNMGPPKNEGVKTTQTIAKHEYVTCMTGDYVKVEDAPQLEEKYAALGLTQYMVYVKGGEGGF